jgi:protein O-GlcNAc transferase
LGVSESQGVPASLASHDPVERHIAAGQALEDRQDFLAALSCYEQATLAAPTNPRAHMNAGNALAHLARWEQARAAFEMAVQCAPGYAPARFNLGALLSSRGERALAEVQFKAALDLQPDMVEAVLMLADLYEADGRIADAETQFGHAIRIDPAHEGAMLNRGWFLVRQGRMEEALAWLQRARAGESTATPADSQILFAMNFCANLDVQEVANAHARIGKALAKTAGKRFDAWTNEPRPDRRLRIGYVSGDFGPHPVALFIRPLLRQHDRSQFEIHCYSNAPDDATIAPTLRRLADHWHPIADLDDARVIEQVQHDGIDILVDLSGHTNRGRLTVFARHPAPVQATWLGYLNTTGLPAMDYRIVDRHTDPPGATEHLNSEVLVRMPQSQWCYFGGHDVDVVDTAHPGRPDAIVFGSFNQYAKITDRTLALWSGVLGSVKGCELVVFDVHHPRAADLLRERMRRHGIDDAQVTMRAREPLRDYMLAIGDVDVAFDTFPYNGATTALDVLWMAVPLVGLRGDRAIARGTCSVLSALGLPELIAESDEQYVDINIRLARDGDWRTRLRDTLRPRLQASPLLDASAFTRALEDHYRAMWHAWCAQHPGADRHVDATRGSQGSLSA